MNGFAQYLFLVTFEVLSMLIYRENSCVLIHCAKVDRANWKEHVTLTIMQVEVEILDDK